MYTGIVQACRPVLRVEELPGLKRITIDFDNALCNALKRGASVSIDGTCLTVVDINDTEVTFEAMQETMRRTTIGRLTQGQRVNIERSASAADEVGGHRIAGHVHGTAEIVHVSETENNRVVTFHVPSEWMKYIFTKGFIALDGASLTVGEIDRTQCTLTVNLIPETRRLTTFGFKGEGDFVNLEIDPQTQVIVDTVERVIKERSYE